MGFTTYTEDIKLLATRMAMENVDINMINAMLRTSISATSLWRWKRLYERTNRVIIDPQTYQQRGRRHILSDIHLGVLNELVDGNASIYLDELQRELVQIIGIPVSQATISRELHLRLGLSHLVTRRVHPGQSIEDRTDYMFRVARIPPEYLVFIDESGVVGRDSLRRKSWATTGTQSQRQQDYTDKDHWTVLPAVCEGGMIAGVVIEGPVERVHVELFLARDLLPVMNPYPGVNSVLVLDNARVHHGGLIEELCRDAGVLLVYLPAYSPDMNPIENCFHSMKAQLRREESWYEQEDKARYLLLLAAKVMTRTLLQPLIAYCGYATKLYWQQYNYQPQE